MSDFVDFIQTVGFPIAGCVYMAWQHNAIQTKLLSIIEENTKSNTELTTICNMIHDKLFNEEAKKK